MNPDWKDYERQIFHLISAEYLQADVSHNTFIGGKKSKKRRQIDVLIIQQRKKKIVIGIGECKKIKRKINLTTIDGIIGKMSDVGADFAIVITTKGCSAPAKELAKNSNVEIKIIPYEFLKDYNFVDTKFIDHEFHAEEVEYSTCYCPNCDTTNVYEIKIVRGFAEHEWIRCPECNSKFYETRTDGGHRVIKRFSGTNIPKKDLDAVLVDHLLWTREGWDRRYRRDFLFENESKALTKGVCEICHKTFNPDFHHSSMLIYKKRKICHECDMSSRTLLIDYDKI